MPMTPLQSWAFLVLLAGVVFGLIWLYAEAEAALGRRRADVTPAEEPDAQEAESAAVPVPVPLPTAATLPVLRLIEGQGQGSRRGPTEVYDWAHRGI
ncbi:hypothetical protein ACFVVC_01735 [Pseudarthrobacter sp. NPDC058196]|uniref:hypothetical protein n=1 Tax=Pseudarthrobacter sp. NPDC058196 TaxID=3346376 RepID=UPI0036DD269B